MTVKQLIDILKTYPEDMPCNVTIGWKISQLKTVTWGVDMDTNATSIWLCA